MYMVRTEDIVRDQAKLILGFDKIEEGVNQGTGQITTFNSLGFNGVKLLNNSLIIAYYTIVIRIME